MNLPDDTNRPGSFELDGGALCLDFANTWGNQDDAGSDRLRTLGDLLAFARQAGALEAPVLDALARSAAGLPDGGRATLELARELRACLFRIFSARAAGHEVGPADLARLNGIVSVAASHRALELCENGFGWRWANPEAAGPSALLWPIAESAASLLTSGELVRVRECDAGDCYWLFLDRSRSGSRRWCSMETCGNRAKARRHYHRKRSEGERS